MTKRNLTIMLAASLCLSTVAQTNKADETSSAAATAIAATAKQDKQATQAMVGENVAIFIPDNFDPALTPSLILLEEPVVTGPLKAGWRVVPAFSSKAGRNVATVKVSGDVSLYGGGEVQGPLLRNGQTIDLWNTDNYSYNIPDRMYQSHPWVMGVRGDGSAFGVIFDSTAKSTLSTQDDEIVYSSLGAPFRVMVIESPTPQELLMKLGELTGTIEMPPLWALGYHQCRFSYYPDSRVKEIADTFRLKSIPCDVIWMDIHYMDGYRIFTFDEERFPDPKGLNDYLHGHGYKAVYMIDPGIKVDEGYWLYNDGHDRGMYVNDAYRREYYGSVWPGPCAFPDFTRPEVREWWSALYKPFMANGIDGIWNDMNEPAVMDGLGGTMPVSNIHLGGGDLPTANHLTYHNAYGRLMVEASREGIMAANPDKRPFVLSRANLLGGQRFAATWTGDNAARDSHMRMSIPMTLTLGLSGQPFNGPDLGGFAEDSNGELLAQWFGFGAFFPFSRGHACDNTNQKEPWVFGKRYENEIRTSIERRYRLLPYYYTMFRRAHETGLPVMAPVFFADVADPSLRSEEQAFLIGDDLLVIPSFAQDPALPKGIWRPLTLIKGDTKGNYQAQLKVRGGSILPVGEVVQNTGQDMFSPLTLVVCPDAEGKASGELYWDAGDGWAFRDGDFVKLRFEAEIAQNGRTTVRIADREGNYPFDLSKVTVRLLTDGKERKSSGDLNKGITL